MSKSFENNIFEYYTVYSEKFVVARVRNESDKSNKSDRRPFSILENFEES